jgi:hypothetical protein
LKFRCIPGIEKNLIEILALLHFFTSILRTPGFVASFVVRTPEQVDAAVNDRELTPVALYTPILSFFILVGLFFLWRKQVAEAAEEEDEVGMPTEHTGLIRVSGKRASVISIDQELSTEMAVARRASVEIMGISSGFETYAEKVQRESMLTEWKALQDMDLSDVDED